MTDSDSGDDFNRRVVGGSNGCNNNFTANSNNENNQKCKRHIVMRIEFDDDDSDASPLSNGDTVDEDEFVEDLDFRPSCSKQRQFNVRQSNKKSQNQKDQRQGLIDDYAHSYNNISSRNLRSRRVKSPNIISNQSYNDGNSSNSGIEIYRHKKKRGIKSRNKLTSDDELDVQPSTSIAATAASKRQTIYEAGFNSDSDNELLEKCPICLLTFREQEVGSPAICSHNFCASCIEAWSKNVQTCPIDRLEFDRILVRKSYENRNIFREIFITLKKTNKKSTFSEDNEIVEITGDDVTNCEICNSPEREDVMLLCDGCNQGYHIDCLDPPLDTIPEGSWYCDSCFDSNDESDGDNYVAEDLNMLYNDIRDMGIPQTRLRVREIQQPRILRTRQNERIRAEVLRRTRANMSENNSKTTTLIRKTMHGGHSSTTTTTTHTTMCTRSVKKNGCKRNSTVRRRRRRTRHRTYVVEYDVNNYDEKFAIRTTRKILKRRRRRSTRRVTNGQGLRLTPSQRLAEQLGVKMDNNCSRFNSSAMSTLSLFGNANDFEYFTDSDGGGNDNMNREIRMDGVGGTAVQTSMRISNIGSARARKALLLGKLQKSADAAVPVTNTATSDILSSIMEIQDRWHNATRNMSRVHIAQDGSLNLPTMKIGQRKKLYSQEPTQNVTEMPMYPRDNGGAGPKFNTSRGSGGNGGAGGENNRYGNTSSYSGGAAGGNQYQRYSTGGMLNNNSSDGSSGGFSNHSFNTNNNLSVGNNANQILNFTPFNMRFNPRNQNQNQRNINNQRNLLPFTNQRRENQQQQQQLTPSSEIRSQSDFLAPPPYMHSFDDSNQLFAGLPAPTNVIPPPPVITAAPGVISAMPPILSVPPPPAPPPSLQPWSNTLFKLNSDYSNDEDDDESNCPNFSVYSQESQAVATMSSTTETQNNAATQAAKDDTSEDINEDLVQLDDDDDIPMPLDEPPTNVTMTVFNNTCLSNLYEPENPTDAIESDSDGNNKCDDDNATQMFNTETPDESTMRADAEPYNSQEMVDGTTSNNERANEYKHMEPSFDSPTCKRLLAHERGGTSDSRKGVLELYDDSDWEELDIDKPIIKEKTDRHNTNIISTTINVPNVQTEEIFEPDRSYTPCLDENNDEEQNTDETAGMPKRTTTTLKTSPIPLASDSICNQTSKEPKKTSEQERVGDIETELITEDEVTDNDESTRRSRSLRRNDSKLKRDRSKRELDKVGEIFKKVGQRQKGRNYRTEKQHSIDRRRRASSSHSISHSKSSRSKSRLCTHSRSRSRSKSRSNVTRSPRRRRTRTRSFSRTSSRSHSPLRSGRRQFNKENYRKFRGNGSSYTRVARFNQSRTTRQYNYGNSYRQKRRELPRYDVRNVIGQSQRSYQKDRYGRDTARQFRDRSSSLSRRSVGGGVCGRDNSRSCTRSSRSRSRQRLPNSPKRARSFSISPSPQPVQSGGHYASINRRESLSPRRFGGAHSPLRHSSPPQRRFTPLRGCSNSSGVQIRSRSITPQRVNNRKADGCSGKRLNGSPPTLFSPRYTPRLSRSRSKTPKKSKKKKKGIKKLKKKKQRIGSASPIRNRRILRQRDPFKEADDLMQLQHNKRRVSPNNAIISSAIGRHRWSPSLSLSPPHLNLLHDMGDKNTSWTPPLRTPTGQLAPINDFLLRSDSSQNKTKEKRKRMKAKKKKIEKREIRKEKRRKRQRTQTPELQPSKEVFASGNNILVSVSFNKEANTNTGIGGGSGVASNILSQPQQTTVVTLPATREDLLSNNRRLSIDGLNASSSITRSRTRKRKKLDAKPVAIIDLERSPFQVHQLPADVIILTDSEDTNENMSRRIERSRRSTPEVHHGEHDSRDRSERDRDDHHRIPAHDKSSPSSVAEHLETILETSYDNLTPSTNAVMASTGPKTPPEPPIVKFQLPAKKSHKMRNNPLHDEADDDDLHSDIEGGGSGVSVRETHEVLHDQAHESSMASGSGQKIGPNTPPESGPCSPDAYDPFEPTKSPSLSPRSPMPPPNTDTSQTSLGADSASVDAIHQPDRTITQKHDDMVANSSTVAGVVNVSTNALNPVDLVMALMNSKSSSTAELSANKANDTQYGNPNNHMLNSNIINSNDDKNVDETQERNSITVLSNVLLSNSVNAQSGAAQHIPVISSPTPPSLAKKLAQMSNNKSGSSIASTGSGINLNPPMNERTNLRNGSGGGVSGSGDNLAGMDDLFNVDIESPYSPGSADYEDLFEPPPENPVSAMRRSKRSGKVEMFDNLFGSSSPIGQHRLSNFSSSAIKKPTSKNKYYRKSKVKVGKSEDHIKVYDDVLSSAVEQQVKDKFLRKLNRQERVVEEVKHVLKPFFNKKSISKDDYKEIMRRAVPKICHSRSGEINPHKIKNLIDAYVKKFRAKHKKLNPINTGQVSSAVKCAAYLKKL